ncbi:unnamed protein product, partial [Gulo gulo]
RAGRETGGGRAGPGNAVRVGVSAPVSRAPAALGPPLLPAPRQPRCGSTQAAHPLRPGGPRAGEGKAVRLVPARLLARSPCHTPPGPRGCPRESLRPSAPGRRIPWTPEARGNRRGRRTGPVLAQEPDPWDSECGLQR